MASNHTASQFQRLFDCLGARLRRFELVEWHDSVRDPGPTLVEVQLWLADQPLRLRGGGNGEDLEVRVTPWQPEPAGDAARDDFMACRDVSHEPRYRDVLEHPLTGVELRQTAGRSPTGVSLRFGDTAVHVHVEFDNLYVTWGGAMPPPGSEY